MRPVSPEVSPHVESLLRPRQIAGVGDIQRSLARLQASGTGRDADNVILYEDAAKRRVSALASALRGLQSLQVN